MEKNVINFINVCPIHRLVRSSTYGDRDRGWSKEALEWDHLNKKMDFFCFYFFFFFAQCVPDAKSKEEGLVKNWNKISKSSIGLSSRLSIFSINLKSLPQWNIAYHHGHRQYQWLVGSLRKES